MKAEANYAKVRGYHAKPLTLLRFTTLIIVLIGWLPGLTVAAEPLPFCRAPDLDQSLSIDRLELDQQDEVLPEGAIRLISGEADITFGGISLLEDNVQIRYGDEYLRADRARFDPVAGRLDLEGGVEYSGSASNVSGGAARFDYGVGAVSFEDAEFNLPENRGHGAAGELTLSQSGVVTLGNVSYTSCPSGNDDWLISARDIDLDTASGVGTARNLKLEFRGFPLLIAPYLSFPISDQRKSGFLIPDFGTSGRNGTELSIPYYWNLAPNYDLTVTPRILTRRGLEIDTQFRYLTDRSEGLADVQYLPNDNAFNADRTFLTLQHSTTFASDWRVSLDARDVSDVNFFEDLGEGQSEASTLFLGRELRAVRPGEHWELGARVQAFQVLDPELLKVDRPYRRLPELSALGRWPAAWRWFDLESDNEATYFARDTGVEGWRFHSEQRISAPFGNNSFFIKPEASLSYTGYRLDNVEAGADSNPDRVLPRFSLDAGATFERQLPGSRGLIQTLTPRILYVHTPFRDQSGLPVFDTIEPDFNLVQIFRQSPLVGVDRIPDTDQVSFGVTTRILNQANGRSLLSATLGQTRYLSTQGVALPGSPVRTSETSDYVAEIEIQLLKNWTFDIGHQWSTESSKTVKSEFRLQYQPKAGQVMNLAYRFREESLEQADVSWAWPINERWNFVGRYNYSLRDKTTLERFVGLEYESCCWAVRVVSRRYIRRRDGTADSSVAIQLELKGLTSVGDSADKRLERGILGYGNRRDY